MAQFLIPMQCLNCSDIAAQGFAGLGLCRRCRSRVRPISGPRCRLCFLPSPAASATDTWICLACRSAPPTFDRLVAAWDYRPPIDRVVRALKFSRLERLSRPMASALTDQLFAHDVQFDVVTFVPLHWGRRLARGFDQSESIAREIARRTGQRLSRTLSRRSFTRTQSRLPLSRRAANVAGVFAVRRGARLDGYRVLLVDDVTTSMSTLSAAAVALETAGAASITAAVVARTPSPADGFPKPEAVSHGSRALHSSPGWGQIRRP